jgi:formiminoglutamase
VTPVEIVPGQGPLVLGLPHTGLFVPDEIMSRLSPVGRALADTDWHVDRLYADLVPNVTTVRAKFHRYVIDANRDPSGASLYPGQNTTGLVPLTDFDGLPLWETPPDDAEIEARRRTWHAPYHAALTAELARIRDLHGFAILFDCHSIRSEIPFLFEGVLPVFNIGTNQGVTCDPAIEAAVAGIATASGRPVAVNQRFKGGWTTRHYGHPAQGVHAIQLELAQRAYLAVEAPPWAYDPRKSEILRGTLTAMLTDLQDWTPA